jgi:extradiol dioxygenase family protein
MAENAVLCGNLQFHDQKIADRNSYAPHDGQTYPLVHYQSLAEEIEPRTLSFYIPATARTARMLERRAFAAYSSPLFHLVLHNAPLL